MLQACSQRRGIHTERPGAEGIIAKHQQADPVVFTLLHKRQGGLLAEIKLVLQFRLSGGREMAFHTQR